MTKIRERMVWTRQDGLNVETNKRLARLWDVAELSSRVQLAEMSEAGEAPLSQSTTLLECDASGGDFAVTLPDAALVKGFTVYIYVSGGNVTVNGVAQSGQTWISNGTQWRQV